MKHRCQRVGKAAQMLCERHLALFAKAAHHSKFAALTHVVAKEHASDCRGDAGGVEPRGSRPICDGRVGSLRWLGRGCLLLLLGAESYADPRLQLLLLRSR